MSHGQFTLQPNHKQGGRGQNYLSISVIDAWNEGVRDATSLSGGESFTASLALAFGLADVVTNESGGKELESLFIDEGFGSLDQDYLRKVMESLYELRESGRMVGLISHVEAMKQDIPMQLLVSKQNSIGTTVQIVENLVN
jgi:exonuclease SbcC